MPENHRALTALGAGMLLPAAFFLAEYLGFGSRLAGTAALLALLLAAGWRLGSGRVRLGRRQRRAFLLYAALLAASLILGRHIRVLDGYGGGLEDNVILPYSLWDLAALPFLIWGLTVLLGGFFGALAAAEEPERGLPGGEAPFHRAFWLLFLLLFAAWLPYLIRFSPGIILGDSLGALNQAVGQAGLDNRNPVVYTLFLRLCMLLGGGLRSGDLTLGCLLYSLAQMLFCSAGLAWFLCWLFRRFALPKGVLAGLGALFGLCPYVALNSVAMWKDPVFSVAVVLWSIKLWDCLYCPESALGTRWRRLRFLLLTLLVLFWRNNGVTAVAMTGLFLGAGLLRRRKDRAGRAAYARPLRLTLAALLLWGVITGPGYRAGGVGATPREESAGMLLNQMVRVAAFGGNMTEADRDYLEQILPLEDYSELYRPCCIDGFKWDPRVNTEALYSRRFYKTWASLLLRNPLRCWESWQLNSYGFWTVNRPEINGEGAVTTLEDVYNFRGEELWLGAFLIRFPAQDSGPQLPRRAWSLPVGAVNWLLLLTALLLSLRGERWMLPALAPSFGIVAGLLLGTPIWNLPRYELPLQLLVPFDLALLLLPPAAAEAERPRLNARRPRRHGGAGLVGPGGAAEAEHRVCGRGHRARRPPGVGGQRRRHRGGGRLNGEGLSAGQSAGHPRKIRSCRT